MSKSSESKVQPKFKQKTLLGFFGGQNGASSSPTPAVPSQLKTPLTKRPDFDGSSVASKSSIALNSSAVKSTPPSSDPVDIDMLDDEDDDGLPMRKQPRLKRKAVLDFDDEDEGKDLPPPRSSPTPAVKSNPSRRFTKKPRPSSPIDDEGEDSIEHVGRQVKEVRQPSRPKPSKARSKSSRTSDDDFIVPSDEDEVSAVQSDAELRSEASHSSKPSKREFARPANRKTGTTVSDAGEVSGNVFLTAAEQRIQAQKSDKKAAEECYSFLQDIRDKDGYREGDPGYDPRTLFIPQSAWKAFTPFEKQFWEIKQNHFDTVLFFQKGKFYELYEQDARIGHQEFDLKLTARVKMCMVGVPEMSMKFWASKFLAKGYKVGRVDQSETALGAEMRVAKSKAGKGGSSEKEKIVRRELKNVLTNGTLVDPDFLQDEEAGHCISVRENDSGSDGGAFGICVLDSATSEFNLSAFEDDICRTRLETLIRQLRPKELVYSKGNLTAPTLRLLKNIIPSTCLWSPLRDSEGFSYDGTLTELKKLYPSDDPDDDDGSGIPDVILGVLPNEQAITALGSMIWYLRQLNIDKDILSMRNFNIYDPMRKGMGLVLDGQTLAHLEVLVNSDGTKEGSLLDLLARCVTPAGKRLFRIWLCMPLRDVKLINERLDAVEDLMNHSTFEDAFKKLTKGLPDLERVVARIHAKNCKIKDFLKVLQAFKSLNSGLPSLGEEVQFQSKGINGLLRSAPDLSPHIEEVESMYTVGEKDVLVPVEGKDEDYDAVTAEIQELEDQLKSELKRLEKQAGHSLVYWHSAQGTKDIYLVQLPVNKGKVPKSWEKAGGTKAVARYKVPDIAPLIRSLKEARENLGAAIKGFQARLFSVFDAEREIWLRAIRVLSELDCLFSLAKASNAIHPAVRPTFVETDVASLEFEDLRHPALCLKKDDFIPNDIKLGGDSARVMLLTGPNMGGKSTLMRMTAAGVIMAQLGMHVPATKAILSPVDSILTRMGAYDNMFSNASTFKVELDECCKILKEATPKSLVILDELGRGTSTYDGMAIAGAVLHHLATQTLALSCFATHYSTLTDDYAYHPQIRNMHMATNVDDEKRELLFMYKLVDGVATGSFGTHVASLAGVPLNVVERAEVISNDFARQFDEKMKGKIKSKLPLPVLADLAFLVKLAEGKVLLPQDPTKQSEILNTIRNSVLKFAV